MRLAALMPIAVMLTACSTAGPRADDLEVSGELNLARTRVTVYVEGEQVVGGWPRLPERGGLGGLAGQNPGIFPLTGSYQGEPVRVECGRLPYTADPYCQVRVGERGPYYLDFY